MKRDQCSEYLASKRDGLPLVGLALKEVASLLPQRLSAVALNCAQDSYLYDLQIIGRVWLLISFR